MSDCAREGNASPDAQKALSATLTTQLARNQSLASCGASGIIFIGFVHEIAGHFTFPWGLSFLGPIGSAPA